MRRLFLNALPAIAVASFVSLSVVAAAADKPGQADLDMATDLQITAETLGDLEKVIKLAESALTKGLDKGQQEFAKKLLASALYQHANRSVESVLERRRRDPRIGTIRQQSLKDLEKAKTYDPELPDIYLLEAKLQVLPGGDLKASAAAVTKAIELFKKKDDFKQLSKAYMLRAQVTEDEDRKLADFEAAAKVDPRNA